MDELTNKEIAEIEAYLLDELSQDQKAIFELRLKEDSAFARKVKIFRTMVELIQVQAYEDEKKEMDFLKREMKAEEEAWKKKPPLIYIRRKEVRLIFILLGILGVLSLAYWIGFQKGKQNLPAPRADLDRIASEPSATAGLSMTSLEKHHFKNGREEVVEQSLILLLEQSEGSTSVISLNTGILRLQLPDTTNLTSEDIRLFEGRNEDLGSSTFILKIAGDYYEVDLTSQSRQLKKTAKDKLPAWMFGGQN